VFVILQTLIPLQQQNFALVSRSVLFDSPNPNFSYAANSLLILIPLQRIFFALVSCYARDSPNPNFSSAAILHSFRAVLVILQPLVNLQRQNSALASCCARDPPIPNSSSAAIFRSVPAMLGILQPLVSRLRQNLRSFRTVLMILQTLISLLPQFFVLCS
jgi:hypothetical protein